MMLTDMERVRPPAAAGRHRGASRARLEHFWSSICVVQRGAADRSHDDRVAGRRSGARQTARAGFPPGRYRDVSGADGILAGLLLSQASIPSAKADGALGPIRCRLLSLGVKTNRELFDAGPAGGEFASCQRPDPTSGTVQDRVIDFTGRRNAAGEMPKFAPKSSISNRDTSMPRLCFHRTRSSNLRIIWRLAIRRAKS